jgi:hypothetical protein
MSLFDTSQTKSVYIDENQEDEREGEEKEVLDETIFKRRSIFHRTSQGVKAKKKKKKK